MLTFALEDLFGFVLHFLNRRKENLNKMTTISGNITVRNGKKMRVVHPTA
jgi:hypothetical protein